MRLCILLVLTVAAALAQPDIRLNQLEYFEGPGFSFHPFHNDYKIGFQGGLQMIQNGERLLDSGDLYLEPKPGQPPVVLRALRRVVEGGAATVYGEVADWNTGYRLICRTDGSRMLITLALDKPLDWSRLQQAGFRISLYLGAYLSKSYQGDNGNGLFPQQYAGQPVLLSGAKRIRVAQEDPLVSFLLAREGGTLTLSDNRRFSPQPWFSVFAPIEAGSDETQVRIVITPSILPEWRKAPVIGVSQVGYHPRQEKRAVLELDPRGSASGQVSIYRLEVEGERRLVKSGPAKPWGRFLRMQYAVFDFTDVREQGLYVAEYGGHSAGPFRIAADVYRQAWEPALTHFLPIQMCKVAVREGNRVWHGACHLDDARQAPAGRRHIDSYHQGERETRFADLEHIPGLDWGGWHDAGDTDLPSGSIAATTLALALAQEEFRPELDRTAVRRTTREVLLHTPDGRSDLLQQVQFGAESLLASFRVAGHIFPGVVESTSRQYLNLGDAVNVTDNLACASASPECDDRWAFTNRHTGLQYQSAQTLAAAHRVLRDFEPALAAECLAAAKKLFEFEQTHPPVYPLAADYLRPDGGFRSQEIAAAAELLLTTGEAVYRDRLLALLPQIRSMTAQQFGSGPGWVLARAMGHIDDKNFRSALAEQARQWATWSRQLDTANPYGVPFPSGIGSHEGTRSAPVWGFGWGFQTGAMHHYYFHKHLPEVFTADRVLAVVNYVLGVHPANNESYVSGVGARSPLMAYGTNRAEWSHIPGGVISGVSLVRPDFLELKRFPFLWYQTEYVIHGAATYIFGVLAAQKILGE